MLVLWMLTACRCAEPAPEPREEHFSAAEQTLRAALTGQDVAPEARDIEAPEEGAWADALHAAVGFLQVAEGPEETAEGLAELAEACGGCHQERGLHVEAGAPGGVPPTAAERAWWGLVFGEGDPEGVAAVLETELDARGAQP
ncbi:MAG: hypothetical protein H6741_17140 [Alphaproteobacteria bacterium]|nr:hypothetical protein [Alphaproteobacteria bacterium]MCB9794442.1 hypothetical protein [Alphaproteobacteria bacterium]